MQVHHWLSLVFLVALAPKPAIAANAITGPVRVVDTLEVVPSI